MARLRAGAALMPARSSTTATLSLPSRNGSRLGNWKMKPILSNRSRRRSALQPALIVDDLAIERDAAAARLQNAGNAMQQGGLAGAARADQSDHLAGEDFQIDVDQSVNSRRALAEGFRQMLDAHDGLFAGRGHCVNPSSRALPPGQP